MITSRRQTLLNLGAVLLGTAALPAMAGPPVPPRAGPRDTSVFLGLLSAGMQSQLAEMRVRLHNYRYNDGRGGYVRDACMISFASGETETFSIEPVELGAKKYYLNDINLERALVRPVPGQGVRLMLAFEGRGTEIKGHCRGTFFECPVGRDDSAPDVQLLNARLSIVFAPEAYRGGMTFVPRTVDFSGGIRAGGICRAPVDLCNVFGHYRRRVREAIESRVLVRLGDERYRARFADALRPVLDFLRIGEVRSLRVVGSNIIVTHTPRA